MTQASFSIQPNKTLFIVTGGANGIGLATSRKLIELGASVFVLDNDCSALDVNLEQYRMGSNLLEYSCVDVTRLDNIIRAIPKVKIFIERTAPKNIIVLSLAGRALMAEFTEGDFPDPKTFSSSVQLNLVSHYNIIWSLRELMDTSFKEKSFLLVSSISSFIGDGLPAYSSAKAGLLALSKSISEPLYRRYQARINVAVLGSVSPSDQARMEQKNLTLLDTTTFRGRILTEDEAADFLIWLMASPNQFVGQQAIFDGGQTIKFAPYLLNK